jgi:uncharacterized membrane protein
MDGSHGLFHFLDFVCFLGFALLKIARETKHAADRRQTYFFGSATMGIALE